MHPFCRSTTLPVLPSEKELDREVAELSDEIDADVEFEEWKESLQKTEDGRLVYRAKTVDKSRESGIIDENDNKAAEVKVVKKSYIGKISHKDILEKEFGCIASDDVIVTDERIGHIQERHPEDYDLFMKYKETAITSPNIIIKDSSNPGTVFMVKKLEDSNLNVVIRLVVQGDDEKRQNSVMTFYRIRQKNLYKMMKKNKTLYNGE